MRSAVSETIMNHKKQISFSLRIMGDAFIYVIKKSQDYIINLKSPKSSDVFIFIENVKNILTISNNIDKLTG